MKKLKMVSQWNFNLMQVQELLLFAFTSRSRKINALLSFNQFSVAAIIFLNTIAGAGLMLPNLQEFTF